MEIMRDSATAWIRKVYLERGDREKAGKTEELVDKYAEPDPARLPILMAAVAMKYQRMPPDVWRDEVGRECLLRDFGEAP